MAIYCYKGKRPSLSAERQMILGGYENKWYPGTNMPKFPNIHLTTERTLWQNFNQETDLIRNRTWCKYIFITNVSTYSTGLQSLNVNKQKKFIFENIKNSL